MFGGGLDAIRVAVTDAILGRLVTRTTEDGLPLIASERGLEKGLVEDSVEWQSTLQSAWDIWPTAGTKGGLESELSRVCGISGIVVHEAVDYAPGSDEWARIWIEIPKGEHPWSPPKKWGDFVWGQGWTWGSSASQAEV